MHPLNCQCVGCKCKRNPQLYGDIRADVERKRSLKEHAHDIVVGAIVTAFSVYLSEKIMEAIRK